MEASRGARKAACKTWKEVLGSMVIGSVGYDPNIPWVWPLPVTVTTRIIPFLVGDPYKPLFATVTGRGPDPKYTLFLSR